MVNIENRGRQLILNVMFKVNNHPNDLFWKFVHVRDKHQQQTRNSEYTLFAVSKLMVDTISHNIYNGVIIWNDLGLHDEIKKNISNYNFKNKPSNNLSV